MGDFPEVDQEFTKLVKSLESDVSLAGWDQPVRLFALVYTADLLKEEPNAETILGIDKAALYTPIEQEVDAQVELDELLSTILWPDEVQGAVVIIERIILPSSAETDLPTHESELVEVATAHPERRDVRMVSAVLRSGENLNALRYRTHDDADSVAIAPNLITSLNEALAQSFIAD